MQLRTWFAIPLLAACGTTRPAEAPDGGGSGSAACTDSTQSTTVMTSRDGSGVLHGWTLDATAGGSVLAHAADASDAVHVTLIAPSGPTELAAIASANGYTFAAAPVDGTSCAVITSSKAGISYACAGAPLDTGTIEALDVEHAPLPFVRAEGTLAVFAQTYAAFTEIDRSSPGQWTRIEEFESSISYPTDVASVGGEPLVCFISDAGSAVLQLGMQKLATTSKATWCKLAVDGSTVHVVTDGGYAAVPLSRLTDPAGTGGTFDVGADAVTARVQRVVMAGGMPTALVYTAGTLSAVSLPSGPTSVLATTTDSNAVVGWDARTGTALLVSTALDTSGSGPDYPETFTFRSVCQR